jgi:O-acetyl-ADP-ribose deacetylase (regulator of RNase III)
VESRKYQFYNSTLTIVFGDILSSKTEVIVCPDDTNISMCDDISAGILKTGGESIRYDAQKKLPAQMGDVIVSSAGMMKQKYIFHCLTMDHESREIVGDEEISETKCTKSIIHKSIKRCLRLVKLLDIKSISFPCIGIETGQNSLKEVVDLLVDEILHFICNKEIQCDIEIYVCNSNAIDESYYLDIISVINSKNPIKYDFRRLGIGLPSSSVNEQESPNNVETIINCDEDFICNLTIDGTEFKDVEVMVSDPFKTIRDQIKSIVHVFELPNTDGGGNPIQYVLGHKADDGDEPEVFELEDEDGHEQCLMDYNVQPGDCLYLISVPIAGGSSDIYSTKLQALHIPKRKHFLERWFGRKSSMVFSSLFAPYEISKGEGMMIQVYIYRDGERDEVCVDAVKSDRHAKEKAYTPLNFKLRKGDVVDVNIRIRGIEIERSNKSFVWQGRYTKTSFYVKVPKDYNESNIWGEVFLSVNNAILGELDFMTNVISGYSEKRETAPVYSRQYKKIFISYAHQDEMKVKYIARAYDAQGVDYFFDRHYLKAGDIFPQVIQNYIDSADLFILCWSENAAKSEYVEKEREQALSLAYPKVKPLEKAKLSIYPMSIEPRAELPGDMRGIYNFEII